MSLRSLASPAFRQRQSIANPNTVRAGYVGHSHFWQRAALSRRSFLGAGAAFATGLALPARVRAAEDTLPNPIPGGLDLLGNGQIFHVYLPGTAPELSTITDFNGVLGAADILGTWSGGGATPPDGQPLQFDADMRFMAGEYRGRDGRHRQGAFAFI